MSSDRHLWSCYTVALDVMQSCCTVDWPVCILLSISRPNLCFSCLGQPLSIPARSQLVHTRLQSLENQCSLGPAPGQTRVVFIRQPLPPSLKVRKAEAKTGVRKDTYLPILNSYPKIAPHPAKGRHRKDHQEQDKVMDHKSKRLWVDELGGQPLASSSPQNGHTMPVESCQAHWQFQNSKQQLWLGATNVLSQLDSASPSPVLSPDLVSPSECSGSSSPSSSSAPSGPLGAQLPSGEPSSIPSPAKQRRFRNTVEILNRSGLLEITLKTKELIRQNGSTQQQVDELKEHVRMFCNAMRSSDPQDVVRLQEAMKHSGAYRISSPSSPGSAQRRGASDQPPLP
ncbi:CLOCK-interacting pacemaker-like [Narcine bancroftii]|uniref:CLOCK-interacting pacemaker-like n=1 Tax=Narcine bancroftii TaxID=1343680 RepID=UPI0038311304